MLLRELWVTNEYGKTSTIDPHTQEEISFVGKLDLIEYNNNKCCYGLKTVNSPSLIDDQINSDMLPAKIIIPQNITPPRIGSKIIVFIEGIDHYMSDYLQGYKPQSAPGFVPGINLGQLSESLNEKADRDLQNLNSTGTNKFSDPDLSNLSDDGKNITNWSSNVTNCVTEIPQDIKLELKDGALTLKAGSKICRPNGFEADGTTPKFDFYTVENDITDKNSGHNQSELLTLRFDGDNPPWLFWFPIAGCYSGSSAPTGFSTYAYWYDTTINKMRWTGNSGSYWSTVAHSFPIVAGTTNSDGATVSIDQIFNGFGYIGSTVFALPGVKVQIPNGRNEDGTYKITPYSTQNVITREVTSTGVKDITIQLNGVLNWATGGVYLAEDGYLRNHRDDGINISAVLAQVLITTAGKIDNFIPRNVDSIANSNASNFSQAGRSYLSGLGMPSNRYIDLTLGASGSTYTAPANGWFALIVSGLTYLDMYRINYIFGSISHPNNAYAREFVPMQKGQTLEVYYTGTPANTIFRFYYAEGEN